MREKLVENGEGSAQGNIISPILANIYMHNVLTLWYKFIIAKESGGENFLIVYADDFIAGFQYKWEAEKYYKLLKERMEKFGLELEESKSRMHGKRRISGKIEAETRRINKAGNLRLSGIYILLWTDKERNRMDDAENEQ